jgi:hypothetical protein
MRGILMASLYYELEDGTGVLVLEDATGNYLLEPDQKALIRHIKTAQNFTETVTLIDGAIIQLDGEDGYLKQENVVSPFYIKAETLSG